MSGKHKGISQCLDSGHFGYNILWIAVMTEACLAMTAWYMMWPASPPVASWTYANMANCKSMQTTLHNSSLLILVFWCKMSLKCSTFDWYCAISKTARWEHSYFVRPKGVWLEVLVDQHPIKWVAGDLSHLSCLLNCCSHSCSPAQSPHVLFLLLLLPASNCNYMIIVCWSCLAVTN